MFAIDANIFLEVELDQERVEECMQFLTKVKDGELVAVLADFTVDSIIIGMERYDQDWKTIRRFLLSLLQYRGLEIYPTTMLDKIMATDHMARYSLDFDDSITLQSAVANNCSALVSFDLDFDRIKGLQRITPAQALLF